MALDPQYTTTPNVASTTLTTSTANSYDGASGTVATCFTAGASGSFVTYVKVKPLGTNSVGVVARFWINNGGATTTATNNFLFGELTLPATTLSTSTQLPELVLPFNIAIPANYKIIWLLSAAPTSAGWAAIGVGGDY